MKRLSAFIFIALFVLYLHNLAPGWGAMSQFNTWDGLEYVNCAFLLGIDHPPGHPFYMLLAKLFTLIPFGEPSWNINVLSALFGALAVAILYLAIYRVLKRLHPGGTSALVSLSVSLTFAFSYVFWSHCEIPEVHTLFLTLVALCVYALVRWHGGGSWAWLNVAALALAVGIGVNILGTCVVFIPVSFFVFLSIRTRTSGKSWLLPLAIFLSGFLLYLYYPIRLSKWPIFSHPMNYLCPYRMGSLSWYVWYMSGRAWTGGQMFFIDRLIPNIPLYLKFAITDLGLPIFILSLLGIVLGFYEFKPLAKALISRDRDAVVKRIVLPFLLVLFLFLLLPEISIHDPSNPRATDYLMNFFLPSLLMLAFLGAYGALKASIFLGERSKVAYGALIAALIAMPIYQFSRNFALCNLRNKNSAHVLSETTLEQIPDGSVIVSKLVYPLVVTYFSQIEEKIPQDKISILDPEVVARELAMEDRGKDLFARKNRFMLAKVAENLARGMQVFIAGDVVDEDKSPEKLLLSDLDFNLWEPTLTIEERSLSFPRELFLYRVAGIRRASPAKSLPEGYDRGIANDGRFANGIVLLGFRSAPSDKRIRRDILSFTVFWTATKEIPEDIYVGMIIMDSRMRRIGEPCWHTLGGSFGVEEWKAGDIVREDVNLFPPPLGPGKYFIAVGMVDNMGDEVKYLAADYRRTGRAFDYVLLMSFDVGGLKNVMRESG